MQSVYDIRKLLLKFGTIIYLGDRLADLEMMETELDELFQVNIITKEEYLEAKLILRKEREKTK
ncbi:YqgQ family protein [Gracilibacillus caseinilyticus]|uniref:YqgQ family protein n=1 Tax=Gracilibacillus caseinilyticus TaxID=2932256 RepID=A0ABY4ESQ0_9BACI|nr:YqgQ family protein [Gracilibacillus caseinilyticus]UOQ47453.1 YqgQ family protein [Gracilibacillus caseinilyticus]